MNIPKLRKYHIAINTHKKAPQIADNVLRNFDCVISEPSSWLLQGVTDEKGLTFIDKHGTALHSSIFRHQPYFHTETTQTEESAIQMLIYAVLFEHYSFEKSDVKIMVTKYK